MPVNPFPLSSLRDLWNHLPNLKEVEAFRSFAWEARPPRLVLVGRRGCGKSTLVNALVNAPIMPVGDVRAQTGQGRWADVAVQGRQLQILDTRGLGEGGAPNEPDGANSPRQSIREALQDKPPDAILFMAKAKEVDARIDEDASDLRWLLRELSNRGTPPVLALLSQVDELDPADVVQPPFADTEKQAHIAEARDLLQQRLSQFLQLPIPVYPICAYIRFREGHLVADRRWNLEQPFLQLFELLPDQAQLHLARATRLPALQEQAAQRAVRLAMAATAAIGATPIPVADMPLISGIQVALILTIARISGRELDRGMALDFLKALGLNLGAAFGFREVARALVKFLPFAGQAISGAVAAAGTYAVGRAAIAFFIQESGVEKAREIFNQSKEGLQEEPPP